MTIWGKDHIPTSEVARTLGLPAWKVRRLAAQRRLPVLKARIGGRLVFSRQAMEDYIRALARHPRQSLGRAKDRRPTP